MGKRRQEEGEKGGMGNKSQSSKAGVCWSEACSVSHPASGWTALCLKKLPGGAFCSLPSCAEAKACLAAETS